MIKKIGIFCLIILFVLFAIVPISVNADTIYSAYWYPKYRVRTYSLSTTGNNPITSSISDFAIIFFDPVGGDNMDDIWDCRVYVYGDEVNFQYRATSNGTYHSFAIYTPAESGTDSTGNYQDWILTNPLYWYDSEYYIYQVHMSVMNSTSNFFKLFQQFFDSSVLEYNSYYSTIYDLVYGNAVSDIVNNPSIYGLYDYSALDYYYNQGKSAQETIILNNPNNYGLYSSSQYNASYQNGYDRGYYYGVASVDEGGSAFRTLVFSVFDAPFEMIFGQYDDDTNSRVGGLFNLNFLGIDLTNFLTALLSIALVVGILRRFI